jgi:dethiobiotin synthetase
VRALKPFCAGDREDALVQWRRLQAGALDMEPIQPLFYKKPLTPQVAAGFRRDGVLLKAVFRHIGNLARQSEILLVEGIGGLLVSQSNGHGVLEVIRSLGCLACIVWKGRGRSIGSDPSRFNNGKRAGDAKVNGLARGFDGARAKGHGRMGESVRLAKTPGG